MGTSLGAKATFLMLRLIRRKRIYASQQGLELGIRQTRQAGPALPTAAMARDLHIAQEMVAGSAVFRLRSKRTPPVAARVVYFHGGAYVRPINAFHWRFLSELAHATGVELVVPLYPLAPEHHGLAALEFARQVHARESAYGDPLFLMGDSAGGGLAIALAAALRDHGALAAHRLILITPWVDVELPHPDTPAIEPRDPMLAVIGARLAGQMYAGTLPTSHPAVSPIHGALHGLPPMTVFVAGRDILSPDAIAFANKARASGCEVDLRVAPDMVHVWPLLGFAESRRAVADMAAVIHAAL
ncbi:MAG: alpha/beta hydrolase fold domain-containing protein [Burkholderiales bacterium]|nr:alpha/beta hydrolase fold domain-containing protein [Burkholderiales bacterium]